MAVRLLAILAFIGGVLPSLAVTAQDRVEWRLENSFRLFKKPEHTELHREVFQELNDEERQAPILAAERKLEERFGGRGWAEPVFNHTWKATAIMPAPITSFRIRTASLLP
jgi:hypothetical protein